MKATGIVRKADQLGRVVVPKEIREQIGMEPGAKMEIHLTDEGDGVIIRRARESTCIFCSTSKGLQEHRGWHVCEECIGDLAFKLRRH